MITVPAGKIVKISLRDKSITDVPLVLSSELTITLDSKFDSLLGNSGSSGATFLNVVGAVITGATGVNVSTAFKEQGYQVWKSTDPIKFSFEIILNMKTSGKKDVFEPAVQIMKIPLPSIPDSGIGIGLKLPGPSIAAMWEKTSKYTEFYSFRCGVYYLPKVLIESVEPTFSSDVDSEGYPIWCTLRVSVSSLYTATQNDLFNFGVNKTPSGV